MNKKFHKQVVDYRFLQKIKKQKTKTDQIKAPLIDCLNANFLWVPSKKAISSASLTGPKSWNFPLTWFFFSILPTAPKKFKYNDIKKIKTEIIILKINVF